MDNPDMKESGMDGRRGLLASTGDGVSWHTLQTRASTGDALLRLRDEGARQEGPDTRDQLSVTLSGAQRASVLQLESAGAARRDADSHLRRDADSRLF